MSSHHIVRDNQEPALLFISSSNCHIDILNQLLEWSPFIICLNQEEEFFKCRDVEPDLVLDEEIVQGELTVGTNKWVKIINKAINILIRKNHRLVNVIGPFDIHYFLENSELQVSIFDHEWKWSYIKNGYLKKWFSKDSELKVYAAKASEIKIDQQKIENLELNLRSGDGFATLESAQSFWVGERIT